MTSQKQIQANLKNSKKSTGPKNTEKTKRNAIKFGIFSKEMLLEGFYAIENKKEFANLVKEVNEEYNPKTFTERLLVEKIIDCTWRLKRIRIAETSIIKQSIWEFDEILKDKIEEDDCRRFLPLWESKMGESLLYAPENFLKALVHDLNTNLKINKEKMTSDELEKQKKSLNFCQNLFKNKRELIERLILVKESEMLVPDKSERLLSYETTIERQLYRAIIALRKLKGWD